MVAAATVAGKPGDFAADGSGYTSSSAIQAYVKAYTASSAGAVGKGLFATRDTAYDNWVAKINDTADAQIKEDKAYVQHRALLKRAYASWAWTTEDVTNTPAVDVVKASTDAAFATYIDAADNNKIKSAKLGATWSATTAVARGATGQTDITNRYFPQLFRSVNLLYNDVITKTLALGTAAIGAATTQSKMTSAQVITRGGAGLTSAIVTASSGLTKDYLTASLAANVATADKAQSLADKTRAATAQGLAKTALTTA